MIKLREVEKQQAAALWATSIILVLSSSAVNPAAITDPSQLGAQSLTIDFGEFDSSYPHTEDTGTISAFTHTSGPIQIGTPFGKDIIWSTTTDISVIGNSTYDLNANGVWNYERDGFTGANNPLEAMSYTFAVPVKGVGGFINYNTSAHLTDVVMTAYSDTGAIIESYNISSLFPISTANDNDGGFRGILSDTDNIARFEVKNAGVVLDDLQFTAVVPLPSTLLLFCASLLSIAGIRLTSQKD